MVGPLLVVSLINSLIQSSCFVSVMFFTSRRCGKTLRKQSCSDSCRSLGRITSCVPGAMYCCYIWKPKPTAWCSCTCRPRPSRVRITNSTEMHEDELIFKLFSGTIPTISMALVECSPSLIVVDPCLTNARPGKLLPGTSADPAHHRCPKWHIYIEWLHDGRSCNVHIGRVRLSIFQKM